MLIFCRIVSRPNSLVTTNITDTYCAGEQVEIAGAVFDSSRPSGTRFLVAANGCDSIINVDLQFEEGIVTTLDGSFCADEFVLVNGTIYDAFNPRGTEQLQTAEGCDSLVNIDLTFVDVIEQFLFYQICAGDGIDINGIMYDRSNPSGTQEFTAANGCDSLLQVEVSFIESVITNIEPTLCLGQSLIINGTTYNETNLSGQETLTSRRGCDSLVNINLSYEDAFEYQLTETLCSDDFLEVNGNIYDESNPTGTEMLTTASGCDSLVHVNLSFVTAVEVELSGTLCSDETRLVNGTIYDRSNPIGQEVISLANGCDSIVNIDLSFASLIQREIREELCPGESYEINGEIYNEGNPVGIEIFSTPTGCDSMYIIALNYPNDNVTNIARTLCAGEGFEVDGTYYTESGFYRNTLTSVLSGCDSTVNLNLHVLDELYAADVQIRPDSADVRGSIFLDIEGGLPPYEVAWASGEDALRIEDLTAGTYEVLVTDALGCTFQANYNVPRKEIDPLDLLVVDAVVSPNPASANNYVKLRFDSNQDTQALFRMLSISGEVVYETEFYLPEGRSFQRIRAPRQAGVYFIHIILANGEQITFRLIVSQGQVNPNG
ncbi:MAG: T9SS type A sorting domain-containing protein [Bacteroidota bacterium]